MSNSEINRNTFKYIDIYKSPIEEGKSYNYN